MVKFFQYIILTSSLLFSSIGLLDVVTTNDLHGSIDVQKAQFINPNHPPTIIGGSGFAHYVKELKSELDEKVLIMDGGNFFQGHPLGIIDSGKTMIDWMNKIGYHALVPGNNDFLFGIDNLIDLSKRANFSFLAANLFYQNNNSLIFKPYEILKLNDLNIGIIGIVNPNLENLVLPQNLENLVLKNPIDILRKNIDEIKNDVDILVLLTSSGVPWDREEVYDDFLEKKDDFNPNKLNAIQLGFYADGIDVIVSGGISKGYPKPWYDPNSHVYTFQNYGGGTSFGHFIINYDFNSKLFMGCKSAVTNQSSQTLFLNDFRYDNQMYNWINTKNKEAYQKVYSDTDWKSKINPDNPNNYIENVVISDNWDFPNINKESNIDIITWNCEFFPTANDSTIDALSEAITDLSADIIAFQEIKNRGWFGKLMNLLPEYNYIISQQSSFMDQAIIYKKNDFSLINRLEIFSENDYNFAGRPPLKADFIYKDNLKFSVINLHMKCCDSGLKRRIKASNMLYDYVVSNLNVNENIIILGDWNDDTKDLPGEHCFESFMDDDRFYFPTHDITYDVSKASYPKEPWVSFLDHILVSSSFVKKDTYFINTIPIDDYMGGFDIYESYISDHMPVYLSFPIK